MNGSVNASPRGRRRLRLGAAALMLAAIAPACDPETEPLGVLTTESFFKTEAQAVQATNATYSMLRDWRVHVFSWIGLTDIASDDATKGSVPGDAGFLGDLDNLTFDPGNLAFNDPWGGYYAGIYRANVAIQGISGMNNLNEALKTRLLGENKFLRAYYYFFLVRAFGGVPLITSPLAPSEFKQQRATKEAVWAQIEQDLTDAVAALPDKYDAADLGRATKGAANALLAEAHLYQGEYEDAFTAASAVINSPANYKLFPDYDRLFRREGENSEESIFEVQAVSLEQGGAGSQWGEVQGVRGTPNLGWGFNNPSPELEKSYEPGDPRLEGTIMYPWEQLPDGSNRVVYLNPQMPNNRYNQKAFISPDNPGGSGNGGLNIRRIRLAHVLLTGAEAAARTNRTGQAQTWLNLVRERARTRINPAQNPTARRTVSIGGAYEEQMAPRIFNHLKLATGTSTVFVRYVDPADPAATAGLRSFTSDCVDVSCGAAEEPPRDTLPLRVLNMDIIQAVNGVAVTTLPAYYTELNKAAPGSPVVLTVLRVSQTGNTKKDLLTVTTPVAVTVTAQALLPNITSSGQALIDAIWDERRHELAMEQHRWFDLIRQGPQRAQQALAVAGKTFVIGKHELYPIPAGEVAIAGLTQNPGY